MDGEADAPVAEWIAYADSDMRVARLLVPHGLYGAIAYHCQQAAEKWTKALMVQIGVAPPKIHRIDKLFDLLGQSGVAIADDLYEIADFLSPFAAATRYPGHGDVVSAKALLAIDRAIALRAALVDRHGLGAL